MTYFDDETTRKKKAAALLLLMHLREDDEQLLQAQHLQVKIVLFHFVISCYLPFYLSIYLSIYRYCKHTLSKIMCIRQCTYLVLLFIFQGRGKPRRRRKPRSMWVRKWLSDKRRERYGHYSTLLNELKTEDEKAFYKNTE